MTNENVLLGTDLKIKVELTCEGFSMDDDDFDLVLRWNGGEKPLQKRESSHSDELVRSDEGDWYLCIETEGMKGLVTLIAKLYVPDNDFPLKDGKRIREEVVKQDLFNVKRP